MSNYLEARKLDLRIRRRERFVILLLFALVSFLTYLGMRVFDLGIDLPISNSILIFALININVILLLLLLFLTMRNLVKLLFERRRNIVGVKLRTKLVLAFVTLSLLPTTILFFVSVQFISSSIEYWFNLQIEQSLTNSLEVGQGYYNRVTEEILSLGNGLSRMMTHDGLMLASKKEELEKFVHDKQKEYHLALLEVLPRNLEVWASYQDHRIDLTAFKTQKWDVLQSCLEKGTDGQYISSSPHGDLIRGVVPVFSRTESKAVVGLIVLGKFIPASLVNRLKAISEGYLEYRQLKTLKKPIKITYMIWLSIVTLLIIFSSVWFGFYLSQGITVPIKELAEGTHRIASGDYDVFIDSESKDEIGVLVNSFNRMTGDLRNSKNQIEEVNKELRKSNVELEKRRLYMEVVLGEVAAGVVSVDPQGNILTVNKSAEKMLHADAKSVIGRNYKELLSGEYVRLIDESLSDAGLPHKGFLKKQVKLPIEGRILTLLVSLNMLRDDTGNHLGVVAVFEDLTEIEKVQRVAAWREVARRIAHEVKNPLTPIQLSTQRLKRRYGQILARENGEVFDECTNMIIQQVEELKRLVNEFSNFARMPAANPTPTDISQIINQSMSLYREAHRDVDIRFNNSGEAPVFNVDREQMKRVMINLLDNAISAIDGKGKIVLDLSYDKVLHTVRIEVTDNGKGIPPEDKERLFEPYFSTKKHGTGLGLAIVNSIITDHNGYIRVQNNKPQGTKFVIELPVRL